MDRQAYAEWSVEIQLCTQDRHPFVRTNALNKVNQLSRRFINYFYYYPLTLFGACILLANTRTIPGKKN